MESLVKRIGAAALGGLVATATSLAAVAMVALFFSGLLHIGQGVFYSFGILVTPAEFPNSTVATIKTAIKGIELFFLAPLPYLVLQTIRRQFRMAGSDLLEEGARNELIVVKTFSLTLIFALVASALAEEALGGTGLTYEYAFSGSAFLLVLGLFILGLKRSLHS